MVIIEYQYWALHFRDRKLWIAYDNETKEAIDYDLKENLIKMCEEKGLPYQVRRYHRKGGFSIIKSNLMLNKEL